MTHKGFKLSLLSLFITGLVLYSRIDMDFQGRNLGVDFTTQDQASVCTSIDMASVVGSGYIAAVNNITGSYLKQGVDMTSSDNSGAKQLSDIFADVMGSGKSLDTNALSSYVNNRLAPLFVFLVFGLLSLIGIFFYCTSCCCPCCCCKNTSEGSKCKIISFAFVAVFGLGSIIVCIVGLTYAVNFLNGATALNCALMTMYYNVLNGQNITTTPRWVGTTGIQQRLNDISSALSQISVNTDNVFKNASNNFINTDPPQFERSLNNLFNTYGQSTLDNPNPANSQKGGVTKVTPIYITNYGNYSTSSKTLNLIYLEYQQRIILGSQIVQAINGSTKVIQSNLKPIQDSLATTSNSIKDVNDAINSFGGNLLNPLYSAQKQLKSNGMTVFYVFFGLILGLGVFNIVGAVLFVFIGIQALRYLNHLSWFLLSIFIIITFILGSVFAIFGTLGQDLSLSFNYLFSGTMITKVFAKQGQAATILDVCINQDGDIANRVFNFNTTNVNSINILTTSNTQLGDLKANLSANSNPITIPNINAGYKDFIDNIRLVTHDDTKSSPINLFSEWNKWSDSATPQAFISSCTGATKDKWSQNSSQCNNTGYSFFNAQNAPAASSGSAACLSMDDWDSNSVSSRYAGLAACGGNSDFTGAQAANRAYFNNLKTYINDNRNLLTNLINENNNLSTTMKGTMQKLIDLLTQVQNLLQPLINITESLIGRNSFFTLINCRFIGADLSNVITTFSNNFSDSAKKLGVMIIIISFFNAVMIIATIFMINFTLPPVGQGGKVAEGSGTEMKSLTGANK